jgi:carboxypeptidase family protein
MHRSFSMVIALLAGLAALLPVGAAAQVDRGTLQLRVTDATGAPLRSAGTISSEAPQFFRAFETDAVGTFVLENLPFGRYQLRLQSEGFAPYSTIVEIRTAVPRTFRIELAVSLQSTVEVSNEPPLVDVSRAGVVFSIGAPQIQAAMPSVPGRRLLDLIDAQPGWLMEANGVLHPRGSEYQTLFVVDGIPMDDNRSPAFAPDLQDSDLQAVHVLTGNFPAEYGRKLGGVVEVTTARDIRQGLHGTAELAGGSFGTLSGGFSGGYGWSRRSVNASVTAAQTDRYLDPPTTGNYANHGTLSGVTLGYDDRPSDSDRLHFSWHQRQTDFLVPNERVQQLAGQRQQRHGEELFGQGGWSRIIGSQFIFDVHGVAERVTATLDSNPFSTPVIVSQDRQLTRGYSNATLAGDFGRHHLKFGGDVVFAPIREQLEYAITDPAAFADDTPQSLTFSDRRHDHEQSVFAQDTFSAGALTASVGLRWDRYSLVVNDHALSPRLGAAWSLANGDLVLRASYDRVFQTPAVENLLLASSRVFEDVSQKAVTLPVRPSRGNFVEGGVTAALWRTARLDVTGYRRTFSQFADDDVLLNTGISFPIAFHSARVNGVDVKVTMPTRHGVSGYVSYSLMKGSATLPAVGGLFLGEQALSQLAGSEDIAITQDQRHTIRGRVRYDISPRVWAATTIHYGSGLPVEIDDNVDEATLASQYGEDILARVNLESGRVRPNVALDLGSSVVLWRKTQRQLHLRIEVANVTNRLNVIDFAGIFSGTAIAAPRSATVGLQIEF